MQKFIGALFPFFARVATPRMLRLIRWTTMHYTGMRNPILHTLLTLLLVPMCLTVSAQDSIQHIWDKANLADTIRLRAISEHIKSLSDDNLKLQYAEEELKLATELENALFKADALEQLGNISYKRGDYDKVLECDTLRLAIMYQLNDKMGIAHSLNNIGITYRIRGDLAKAIDYYLKSLKIKEEIGDQKGAVKTLNNIGLIYREQQEHDKAREYFQRGLDINTTIKDSVGIGFSYSHIGTSYFDAGWFGGDTSNFQIASKWSQKSLAILEEIGDQSGIARLLNNIGFNYYRLKQFERSIGYYKRSLAIKEELGDKRAIGLTLRNLGNSLYELERYDESIFYQEQGLVVAQEIGWIDDIERAASSLSGTYQTLGNYEKALEMFMLEVEMRDSIQNEQNTKEIIRQEYKYEYAKKALSDSLEFAKREAIQVLELDKQEAILSRQRIALFSALAGLILVFALGFSLYKGKKKSDQQNKEKEALLQEIHHRVKNNLQIIISLLRLQHRRVEDKEGQRVLEESMGRIKTMSLIHQNLYQSENLGETGFKTYLEELMGHIMSNFQDVSDIKFELKGLNFYLDTEKSIPLALIAHEWVNNIYKHAFPNNKGSVTINLLEEEGSYKIQIADDGVGISKEELMASKTSLGAKIIRTLSRQIDAVLDVDRRDEGGTLLQLTLKKEL